MSFEIGVVLGICGVQEEEKNCQYFGLMCRGDRLWLFAGSLWSFADGWWSFDGGLWSFAGGL